MLQVASLAGQLSVVEILLSPEHGLPLEHYKSSLSAAAQGGHVEVIQAILNARPDLDNMKAKAHILFQACKYGRIKVVKLMISLGVHPHYEMHIGTIIRGFTTWTGLQFAAMQGRIDIVRLLVDYPLLHYSADHLPLPNTTRSLFVKVKPAMDLALKAGHLECVETLFNLGCFPKMYWAGRLTFAYPNVSMIRLLARLGVDFHTSYLEDGVFIGQRMMIDAIEHGFETVVRCLLELGVSPNSPEHRTHHTMLAKVYGFDSGVKTLLGFGGKDIYLKEMWF